VKLIEDVIFKEKKRLPSKERLEDSPLMQQYQIEFPVTAFLTAL
jgi:hypothetical protein